MLLTHPAEKSSQHKTVTCDGVKESIASVRMPQDEQTAVQAPCTAVFLVHKYTAIFV
jgi:hypothetical protein